MEDSMCAMGGVSEERIGTVGEEAVRYVLQKTEEGGVVLKVTGKFKQPEDAHLKWYGTTKVLHDQSTGQDFDIFVSETQFVFTKTYNFEGLF